jgi:RHS repeat-associated protein
VKRTMADGSWTVYIGGIYEKRSNETYVKYYSAFGRRIAMRDNAGVVHYILSDHLGSSTVITDGAGAVVGTMNYYPYGAERSSSGGMITDKLFTGQQKEPQAVSTLGLYNYGARFYSTLTGRFVSPDPFVPDAWDVAKALGPALMVMLPSGFSGGGGDSVYGPVVGLMRGDQTTGLYVYVPPDDDVWSRWPAEGFMPRQHLLDPGDLNADYAPAGPDEAAGWPKDTVAPNPQPLNRFAYVLGNPLRYTDPNGYGCGPLGGFCDWVGDQVGNAGEFLGDVVAAVPGVVGGVVVIGGGVALIATGGFLIVVGVAECGTAVMIPIGLEHMAIGGAIVFVGGYTIYIGVDVIYVTVTE